LGTTWGKIIDQILKQTILCTEKQWCITEKNTYQYISYENRVTPVIHVFIAT